MPPLILSASGYSIRDAAAVTAITLGHTTCAARVQAQSCGFRDEGRMRVLELGLRSGAEVGFCVRQGPHHGFTGGLVGWSGGWGVGTWLRALELVVNIPGTVFKSWELYRVGRRLTDRQRALFSCLCRGPKPGDLQRLGDSVKGGG